MKRRLITAFTVAALALTTAFATPAAAMSDKDRRALTLLLGAAAVGVIISESNKNKKKRQAAEVARNPGYGHDILRDQGSLRRDHRRGVLIPAQCAFSVRGGQGPREVVSSRCLSEMGLNRRLPRDCAFEIDTGWGSRTVYGARCLRQNGYRIAGMR